MRTFENFRAPQIDLHDSAFDEHVEAVNEHLSSLGHAHFVELANNASRHQGMEYMRVGGGKDQSQHAALIMPGTFANGVWPHIVARAEALSYQAAEAGMVDDRGNILPVLVTAAPSARSNFGLDKQELHAVRRGDFSPIAARHIILAHMIGIEFIPGAIGTSQGGAIVAPFMENAQQQLDTEALSAVLIEPPHARKRTIFPVARQLANFAREGSSFEQHVQDEAIEVIDELFTRKLAADNFEKGIVKEYRENLAIVHGFGRGGLARDLSRLVMADVKTTVVWGTESFVANGQDMVQAVASASIDLIAAGINQRDIEQNLKTIEITNANHSFGDRVGRFATVAAAGLTR